MVPGLCSTRSVRVSEFSVLSSLRVTVHGVTDKHLRHVGVRQLGSRTHW